MRHALLLDFENLEARKLLSRGHIAVSHTIHSAVTVPLALDGTLAVDQKGASTTPNSYGGMTTTTPVAGVLGALGKVRGVWTQSVNTFDQNVDPETIQLHNSKGSFTVAFNSSNLGKAHRTAQGYVYNDVTQRVHGGTRAYIRATESGTIQLTTNSGRTNVQSMTLSTHNS